MNPFEFTNILNPVPSRDHRERTGEDGIEPIISRAIYRLFSLFDEPVHG
jgi:hypothetical protein